jgi:hypothetical protein
MKIALMGAQGVGKTSLAKALHNEFPDSFVVRETVRECPYPCDQNADFKTEWWVLSHSILAEQEARELGKNLIITDRCPLDIAIYTKLIHESRDGRITDVQRGMIERVIGDWLKEDPYDFLFFVKVDPKIWAGRDINDGFRSIDPKWFEILTAEFEAAVARVPLPSKTRIVVIQNNGSFEESYQHIRQTMMASASPLKFVS